MKGNAGPRALPCVTSLHRTGPLRPLVKHNKVTHVLRHPREHPFGVVAVRAATAQAPHGRSPASP